MGLELDLRMDWSAVDANLNASKDLLASLASAQLDPASQASVADLQAKNQELVDLLAAHRAGHHPHQPLVPPQE